MSDTPSKPSSSSSLTAHVAELRDRIVSLEAQLAESQTRAAEAERYLHILLRSISSTNPEDHVDIDMLFGANDDERKRKSERPDNDAQSDRSSTSSRKQPHDPADGLGLMPLAPLLASPPLIPSTYAKASTPARRAPTPLVYPSPPCGSSPPHSSPLPPSPSDSSDAPLPSTSNAGSPMSATRPTDTHPLASPPSPAGNEGPDRAPAGENPPMDTAMDIPPPLERLGDELIILRARVAGQREDLHTAHEVIGELSRVVEQDSMRIYRMTQERHRAVEQQVPRSAAQVRLDKTMAEAIGGAEPGEMCIDWFSGFDGIAPGSLYLTPRRLVFVHAILSRLSGHISIPYTQIAAIEKTRWFLVPSAVSLTTKDGHTHRFHGFLSRGAVYDSIVWLARRAGVELDPRVSPFASLQPPSEREEASPAHVEEPSIAQQHGHASLQPPSEHEETSPHHVEEPRTSPQHPGHTRSGSNASNGSNVSSRSRRSPRRSRRAKPLALNPKARLRTDG